MAMFIQFYQVNDREELMPDKINEMNSDFRSRVLVRTIEIGYVFIIEKSKEHSSK